MSVRIYERVYKFVTARTDKAYPCKEKEKGMITRTRDKNSQVGHHHPIQVIGGAAVTGVHNTQGRLQAKQTIQTVLCIVIRDISE